MLSSCNVEANIEDMDNSTASVTKSEDVRLGWTGGTNDRGTMDIIWGCALTMFLYCWSILVVNVPTPGSTLFQILRQKSYLLCLSLLAPEIVFQVALGQFLSAKRATAEFRAAGHEEWGLRHSFYVDMGALHLRSSDFKSFPINAKQLLYLIEHHYVDYPEISEDAIRDKNKIDGMLRAITALQAMWFVVNLVARSIQHLAISCLELSTASWVIFCLGTTVCWSKKPADVEVREFIDSKVPLAQILMEGGAKAQALYYYTPLDFASREEWPWSRLWNYGLGYLRAWKLVPSEPQRPIQRFGDTVTPVVPGWWYALFVMTTISYFSVFLAAWNFSFPSHTEHLLWRIATLSGPVSVLLFVFSLQFFCGWQPQLEEKWHKRKSNPELTPEPPVADFEISKAGLGPTQKSEKPEITYETTRVTTTTTRSSRSESRASNQNPLGRLLSRIIGYFRNNSTLRDPEFDCPLKVIILTWLFGIAYCFSRGYVVVEDLMELRSLPASTYETVNWTNFWPHF